MNSITLSANRRTSSVRHFCAAIAIIGGSLLLAGQGAHADEDSRTRFQTGVSAGTLGFGAEIGIRSKSSRFGFRAGFNSLAAEREETVNELDLMLDLSLSSYSGLVDWYPAGNAYRLTAGMVANSSSFGVEPVASDSFDIGDETYTSEQVGNLRGEVVLAGSAPYAGFGWAIPVGRSASIDLEFGAVFQEAPTVVLTADGSLSQDPVFQADLENTRRDIEDDLAGFSVYPVGRVGFTIRF